VTAPQQRLDELFEKDHARVMGMLSDVDTLCRKHSFFSAAKVFGQFRWLLEHHLAQEDKALESLRGAGALPAPLLQRISASHVKIKQAVERTWAALSHNAEPEFARAMADLIAVVTAHERQEREELVPALRRQTTDTGQLEQTLRHLIERC
jgi:hypothetical protein